VIAINETIGRIWASGTRKGEFEVSLPHVFTPILNELTKRADILLNYIDNGGSYHTPCFCGNGQTYQFCHGNGLLKEIDLLWAQATSALKAAKACA